MTQTDFEARAAELKARIKAEEVGKRHLFQPELHRLVEEMAQHGVTVPKTLRNLDEELTDDAIEAQFDNMPV